MDDIVLQALAKWPHVPHCYAWLGLDARGRWWMRDAQAQALGAFPESKGSLLQHDKLLAFIQRNYAADERGQWFFQNGPQRVYVELEATPMIWRVHASAVAFVEVYSHTGYAARVQSAWVDEHGAVYLLAQLAGVSPSEPTDPVLGLVHSQDVGVVADCLERGLWPLSETPRSALPARFGFVRHPQARSE